MAKSSLAQRSGQSDRPSSVRTEVAEAVASIKEAAKTAGDVDYLHHWLLMPRALLRQKKLIYADVLVLDLVIRYRTGQDSEVASKEAIARALRRTPRTIQRSLKRLEAVGFIVFSAGADRDPNIPKNLRNAVLEVLAAEKGGRA